MTLREGAARSRLEVSLESDRTLFIRELHHDIDLPRSIGRCVRTPSVVVSGKSRRNIRC
jgi:hypothetical protein